MKNHRDPNALAFENTDPNNTLWAEESLALDQTIAHTLQELLGERSDILQTVSGIGNSINFNC